MSLISNVGFQKVSLVAEEPKGEATSWPSARREYSGRGRQAMSVMAVERGVPFDTETREMMPGGIAASAVMHLGIFVMIILGLPTLFRPPIPEEQPIAVELVMIAPETRATHPNPNAP